MAGVVCRMMYNDSVNWLVLFVGRCQLAGVVCRTVSTGWRSSTSTSYTAYCVTTWDLARHCSPSAFSPVITVDRSSNTRYSEYIC